LTLYIHICNPVQSSYSLRIPLDNTSRPLFDKLPFLKQPYTLHLPACGRKPVCARTHIYTRISWRVTVASSLLAMSPFCSRFHELLTSFNIRVHLNGYWCIWCILKPFDTYICHFQPCTQAPTTDTESEHDPPPLSAFYLHGRQ
jgi:hypothetical protein